ncbi:MAG: ABC transporter permease [Planctomycetaceae bacterium]
MTRFRFLLRSLLFYWRTNLAVLLGVIAGTAVIGGALIVGDSVRGSLRQMTFDRLGGIDHVLTGPRFFREQLAADVAKDEQFKARFAAIAPALVLTGGLKHRENVAGDAIDDVTSRRIGKVNVYGLDERAWKLTEHGDVAVPADEGVVLNRRVATQLDVVVGESITLWIELPAAIPRDSLLGNRDTTTVEIPLTVTAILEDDVKVARLSLHPNQQLPLNAFVSLPYLQRQLGLHERAVRRTRIVKPARINTLFVRARTDGDRKGATATDAARSLTSLVKNHITPADLYLRINRANAKHPTRAYLSLESEQQVLADEYRKAALSAAKELKLTASPVLVYLANEILDDSGKNFSRYSVVAGLNIGKLTGPPFGPFEFIGPKPPFPLGERDILINEWLAADVKAKTGDKVRLKYHVVGAHILAEDGRLPEETKTFAVKGIVKLDGTPADDRGLTPEVEGITDVDSFDEWKKPFPMKDVTKRDDAYWTRYRATPKAFVSLNTAQDLWKSRYGKLTSVRVARLPGKSLEESANAYAAAVLKQLTPQQTGLFVRPVKFEGLQAASGTTDFSGLFIGFSFFLILSAAILIGLLFRLGIERRGGDVGLLEAVGYGPKRVRRMFLAEGSIVVLAGGLLGSVAAWGYASLMVYGLKTWWIGAIGTRFLDVYVTPLSLGIGFGGSVLVSLLAVWWGLRHFRKLSSRELLAGAREVPLTGASQRKRGNRAAKTACASGGVAVALVAAALAGLVPAAEAFGGFSWQVVTFFLVGVLLLVCGLSFLAAWLDGDKAAAVQGRGLAGTARLGMRNAARNRQRSVMTVALIASATFVIVAIAAGHRNPAAETPDKSTGNGGFSLVAESSAPILHDLNTTAGRRELQLDFTAKIREAGNRADEADRRAATAKAAGNTDVQRKHQSTAERERARVKTLRSRMRLLENMHVVSFRVKPGEDASCLNIFQTRVPTLLGVPDAMIRRGGFKFVGAKRDNPWTLLTETHDDEDGVPVYPVLGDMNTLQYSLHKSVGKTVGVPNDDDPLFKLKIVGMFDGSVFQGVLLLSEENFQALYPEQIGYRYFLVDVPFEEGERERWTKDAGELESVLESGLTAYGFDTQRVTERLAGFLAVQNTYLSTFQALGGLGLLLGTLGLATVMLRNVLERRSELALLRAVGFRNGGLSWLVIVENAFLLLWGLLSGTVSALLAMAPHLASTGADVPWAAVGEILAAVFAVGMLAALAAVWEAVRTPIVATLRAE